MPVLTFTFSSFSLIFAKMEMEIPNHQNAIFFFYAKWCISFKTEKFFHLHKIIKTGQFSKVISTLINCGLYLWFIYRQLTLDFSFSFSFFSFWSCEHFSDLKGDLTHKIFTWILPIYESFFTFVQKMTKRKSFGQFAFFFFDTRKLMPTMISTPKVV